MVDVISWMKKKLEIVISAMQNFQLIEDTPQNLNTDKEKENIRDGIIKGFLLKADFKESEKKFLKMNDVYSEKVEENKRLLQELYSLMQFKISEREIKLLEEFLFGKIEDMKINNKKKFALKFDTEKSIKMLESQVKYIIDSYIKRDKPENWMMAKKNSSASGFECASCENYIGDLTSRGQGKSISYKYPMRDPGDMAYRVRNTLI